MHETTRLLRDLVMRPSVNPMGRPLSGPEFYEHQVTAYLEKFFFNLGVPVERHPVAPLRDNIVAVCETPSPSWTLVLEVHQDTVPTDNMTIDPFGARIDGNRLYGRGSCDIKGGMAAMLAAFARLVRDQPGGGARVVLACTVDEEFTFLGVQQLAKLDLRGGRRHPIHAVIAEPTDLNIVDSHKGAVRWDLTTLGRSCHSSRPEQGINAIYHMAELLPLLQRYADELQTSKVDPRLGSPSMSVGRIEGGVSVNTVPNRCRIEIDRRILPGENARAALGRFLAYLREKAPKHIQFECPEQPWLCAPALSADLSGEITAKLGVAIDSVRGTHEVQAVPYGTDASVLAEAGIPSVVFGPGDIHRAHTCDEWVPLDEVEMASEILYRLACAPSSSVAVK
jgi:acetylornithine deacetylase/succinyl-diaminopimelate desuccinylase-like protein